VKLKVIAGLLGLGLDELVRRENQRRTQRLFWLSAGMAAAMVVMGVLPVTAIQSRNDAVIARNDNWDGLPQLTTVGNSVGAFAITDANSNDAILLITLAPGSYTAQLSGLNGSSGLALLEVYEVP